MCEVDPRKGLSRRLVAFFFAVAILAAGEPAGAASPVSCRVVMSPSGSGGTVTWTNTGASAVSGWNVAWTWLGGERTVSAWSATFSQNGAVTSFANLDWNSTVQPGASAQFGFGTDRAVTAMPVDFTVNGWPCEGSTAPSPTPTAIPTLPPDLADDGKIRIYYFAEWGVYARDFGVADIAPHADDITHIQYAFINLDQNGNCTLFDSWAADQKPGKAPYTQAGNLRQLAALRDDHPHLRIVMSIGGWTLSDHFSDVAADATKLATMASSCVALMRDYDFDGLDVDWEFPGVQGEGSNSVSQDDDENFVIMLSALRSALDTVGAADGRHYSLSVAISAGEDKIVHLRSAEMAAYVDFMSVMSYDLNGAWQTMPAHNAPLYRNPDDPRPATTTAGTYDVNHAVDLLLNGGTTKDGRPVQGGVPPGQIAVGVPFYGRAWVRVPATQAVAGLPGLFTTADNGTLSMTGTCSCEADYANVPPPIKGAGGLGGGSWEEASYDYDDVANILLRNGWTRYWDATSQVPFAYNPSYAGGSWVSYDDGSSLCRKGAYVRNRQLAGIMAWELSGNEENDDLWVGLENGLDGTACPAEGGPTFTPTAVRTATPLPPSPTRTATSLPATATASAPAATPTATRTATIVPPSPTRTAAATGAPATPSWTPTAPPVLTATRTATSVPPATSTPVPASTSTATVAPTAAGMRVTFARTSMWDTGYNGEIKITNNGSVGVGGWTLAFDLADAISSVWSGVLQPGGPPHYAVMNESWNGTIAPGATVSFGFTATNAGSQPAVPGACVFNGVACQFEAGASPTQTPGTGIVIGGVDQTFEPALQITVSQGQTDFALSLAAGGTPEFSVASNNPAVVDAVITGGTTLRVNAQSAGRAGLRITDAVSGATRYVGIRVRTAAGDLPGMPDYVAAGSVSEDSDSDLALWRSFGSGLQNTRVDVRYIYLNNGPGEYGWYTWAGGNGNRARRYIRESKTLGVIPFFVYYNIPDAGESYYTDLQHIQDPAYMAAYFADLVRALDIISTEGGDDTVGIILEPDFLGYMMQNSGLQPAQIAAQVHAVYDAGILTRGIDPDFADNVTGLVQAVNYIISSRAPNAVFGWQFNLWASLSDGSGIPATGLMRITDSLGLAAGRARIVQEAQKVADYYLAAGVTSYGADFVSVDKYGLDGGFGGAAAPWNSTWFWNAIHWNNYLLYTQGLNQRTGVPVMLWQIPVGHINHSLAANPRDPSGLFPDLNNTSQRYEDSAPSFFYGDTFTTQGDVQRQQYFGQEDEDHPESVSIDGTGAITWASHMTAARDAGVAGILFGDGVGDATHGRGSPPPDGYWWITKTQAYLMDPVPRSETAPTATPSVAATATAPASTPTRTATRPPATATSTHTATAAFTATATASATPTSTATRTATAVPTATRTATVAATATRTSTGVGTATRTPTRTPVRTATRTPARTPTRTPTRTSIRTATRTPTLAATPTRTKTAAATATRTAVPTATRTAAVPPTATRTSAATAVATATATSAAASVRVAFSRTVVWDTGYNGQIDITNNGGVAINGWTLAFDLADPITTLWNGILQPGGPPHEVVLNEYWNGTIQPGATVSIGFGANLAGAAPAVPSGCTFNGAACQFNLGG